MRGGDAQCRFTQNVESNLPRNFTLFNYFAQGLTFDKFRDEIMTGLVAARVINKRDIRMANSGSKPGFRYEAF